MNVETLRAKYNKLTPFEREALLIKEAVGRRREAETDALESRNTFEALWMSHWGRAFFTVASFAMFWACWSERTALLLVLLDDEGKVRDVKGENTVPDYADKCFSASVGWIRAMQQLEEESGAPFMACSKMLDSEYAERLLRLPRSTGETIDFSSQYRTLRSLWDAECSGVNVEDAWRKLPTIDTGGGMF